MNQKAVRDRFKLLVARFKRKINEEEAASGIFPEESELDQAFQNIFFNNIIWHLHSLSIVES